MAATGILCQMADKIKYLSEQCTKLLEEKQKRTSETA